jgi:hypothetical protein
VLRPLYEQRSGACEGSTPISGEFQQHKENITLSSYWSKTGASRINSPGVSYPWAGTGVSASTAVGTQTVQVRIISQLAGYVTIGTSSDPTIATTGGVGTFIAANTANGDYFTVTPGQ